MKNQYLEYNQQLDSFIIKQSIIDEMTTNGIIPSITIKDATTIKDAPTIGIIMGQEQDLYATHSEYIETILDTGANIKFLDYNNPTAQLNDCHGLLLIGGTFATPKQFYADKNHPSEQNYNQRFNAYVSAYLTARAKKIPILGICAGAQLIAILNGFKADIIIPEDSHKTTELNAHQIKINKDSLLYKIIKKEEITVNSRHKEKVLFNHNQSDFSIFATSTQDNILEAWGDEKNNTLCIQWHPETIHIKNNNKEQLAIYQWLTDKAKDLL